MIRQILTIVVIAAVMVSTMPAWAQEPTWRTVVEWKGTGNKTTEVFTVKATEWRVRWERTVVGYAFDIYVYRPNPNPPTVVDCKDRPAPDLCEREQEELRLNPWMRDQLVARGGPGMSIRASNEYTNIIPVRGSGRFYLRISAGFAPSVWTVVVQEPEGTGRTGDY